MPKNILIIEDDSFIGLILKSKLEKNGYSCTYAGNGQIGMACLEEGDFDAVVLDLIMPHVDGFKVLEEIKANPKLAKVAVIVASNLSQKEDIEKAKRLGAKDYFIKSDTPLNEIVEKITALV